MLSAAKDDMSEDSSHVMLSEAKHLVAQDEQVDYQMLRFAQHDMVAAGPPDASLHSA